MGTVRFNEGTFAVRQALYTSDGKSLVTVNGNHAVHVWDVATGRIVRSIGNPESRFREIAISADGEAMATIEEVPGRLRLWDLASVRERRRWHGPTGANNHRLTFSPDGKTVAAATTWHNEVFIHLWDTTAPTERRRRIEGMPARALGHRVLSRREDAGHGEPRSIRACRRGSGHGFDSALGYRLGAGTEAIPDRGLWRALGRLLTGRQAAVRRRHRPDNSGLRFGHRPRDHPTAGAGACDPAEGERGRNSGRQGGDQLPGVLSRRIDPRLDHTRDGERGAASAGRNPFVGCRPRHGVGWIPAHGQWIMSLSFAPDSKTIASTGAEPVIRLWDVATGRAASPQVGHRSGIHRLIISPTDGTLFTAPVRWHHPAVGPVHGRELGKVADFLGVISGLALSPDGQTLVVGDSMGRKLFLWSVEERREIRRFPRVPVAEHNYVDLRRLLRGGKMVAAELRVWDVASGRVLATFRDQQAANDFTASSIPIFPPPTPGK